MSLFSPLARPVACASDHARVSSHSSGAWLLLRSSTSDDKKKEKDRPCKDCRDKQLLQRDAAPGSSASAPASFEASPQLTQGGARLPAALRDALVPVYGSDFGEVRIHNDATSHAAAREVGARAFTLGQHIHFSAGEYQPHRADGLHLLSHELGHTLQQRGMSGVGGRVDVGAADSPLEREADAAADRAVQAMHAPAHVDDTGTVNPPLARIAPQAQGFGSMPVLRRAPKSGGKQARPSSPWKTGSQVCGRDTHENIDFPNTRIRRVNVDLAAQNLSLEWENPTGLSLPTGPFDISTGAGRCCVNCDDETTSQTANTLCTPKGNWRVHSKGCVLSSTAWAKNPTYFSRAGIAIHAGPRPGYPASHGCVRTTTEASEIIHDNSVYSAAFGPDEARHLPDRRTEIVVSGTWAGRKCYPSTTGAAVERSRRCSSSSGSGGSGRRSETEEPAPAPSPSEETVEAERVASLGDDGPGPA